MRANDGVWMGWPGGTEHDLDGTGCDDHGVLVHPRSEPDDARDGPAERRRHPGGGPAAEGAAHGVGHHGGGRDPADEPQRELVGPFGVQAEQEGAGKSIGNQGHG